MSEDNRHISYPHCLGNEIQDPSIPPTPTRIILILLVKDFDSGDFSWFNYPSAVEAYLKWSNRPIEDYRRAKKHNIFVEQFQAPELKQKKFHVILDLNCRSYKVENMDSVHHEVYEVRRDGKNGQLCVLQAKLPTIAEGIIRQTRVFTDKFYPWGSQGWEKLASI